VCAQRAGLRLDSYLSGNFPFLSRAGWQKRIDLQELLVNGVGARASYKLKSGDLLTFFHPPEVEPEVDRRVRVIWQEGAVMCAFKPACLPMHENGPYRKSTFSEIIKTVAGPEWSAVHRLDLETSGIVLCGATADARNELARQMRVKKVVKEYLAIARGKIPADKLWVVDAPIGDLKTSRIRIKKWVVADGLPARTEFMQLATKGEHVLLRARPLTGRTNQIRIHAAFSALPLVGDKLFHDNEDVFLDYFENGRTDFVIKSVGHHRACLHAHSISFAHPETGREAFVCEPMAEDMLELWDQIG